MPNVHLVKSEEYSSQRYWDVVHILNAFDGPISFISHEKEVEHDEGDTNPEIAGDTNPPFLFKEEDVLTWDDIFKKCNAFRGQKHIPKEDFVLLLTEKPNELNWFSGSQHSANNLFVHTGYWEYFIACEHQYPVAYECAASVLRKLMFRTPDEINSCVHWKTIGCINDFCENKEQIILKLRTGDICQKCFTQIDTAKVPPLVTQHVLSIIGGLREQMLFRQGFSITKKLSVLKIQNQPYQSRIILSDYGNMEIKLTPLEKTVYLLFLNHPEGINFNDLADHRKELEDTYRHLANNGNAADLKARIDALIDPTEGSISEKVARIKRKFTQKIGEELAEHYIIKGSRGQVKRIILDREFVTYN